MSRPRALTLVSLAVTSLLAACGKDGGNTPGDVAVQKSSLPRDTAPAVSTEDAAQLAAGNQAFAIDLYHQLSAQPGNLIYSPTSISLALAMLYNGAAGATADQMAAALHFSLPLPGLNAAFDATDLALTASSGGSAAFQLSVANIAVDEAGTTAAAATGVTLRTLSVALHSLTVDRPFLFFIVHQPTGAILFAGRVVDPSAG